MRAGRVRRRLAAHRGALVLQGACVPLVWQRDRHQRTLVFADTRRQTAPRAFLMPHHCRRARGDGLVGRAFGASISEDPRMFALGATLLLGVVHCSCEGVREDAESASSSRGPSAWPPPWIWPTSGCGYASERLMMGSFPRELNVSDWFGIAAVAHRDLVVRRRRILAEFGAAPRGRAWLAGRNVRSLFKRPLRQHAGQSLRGVVARTPHATHGVRFVPLGQSEERR